MWFMWASFGQGKKRCALFMGERLKDNFGSQGITVFLSVRYGVEPGASNSLLWATPNNTAAIARAMGNTEWG